jgi:hypothetical protein
MTDWANYAPPREEWNLSGADHDKPYAFGDAAAMEARLTHRELHYLLLLRLNVLDVRNGYVHGRAAGDIGCDGSSSAT